MTTYSGTDAIHSKNVNWFTGGVQVTETTTVTSGDVSDGYIATAKTAEWGSMVLTVNGTVTAPIPYAGATGGAIATEATGCLSYSYSGIAADDVAVLTYLDVTTTALTEVAMSQDVKTSWKGEETSDSVNGQVNKIKTTGAVEQTATLNKLTYTQDFIASFMGDQVTDASGNKIWSTKYTGFIKVGALVGIEYDTSDNVVYKWFLYGVEPSGIDKDFAQGSHYKETLTLNVDEHSEFQVSA